MKEKHSITEREPVQIVNGILAIIGLLVSFGVIVVSPEQMEAIKESLPYIIAFAGAAFSLIVFLANKFIVRARVTPTAVPVDDAGNKLVPEK